MARNRKLALVAEQIFKTRKEAEEWLATVASEKGDRKRISPFKLGAKAQPYTQYAARVYKRVG